MSEWQSSRQLEQTAKKWRDLAERSRDYFINLYESGRWKRYYDERSFLLHMRQVAANVDRWADLTASDAKPAVASPDQAEPPPSRRAAA